VRARVRACVHLFVRTHGRRNRNLNRPRDGQQVLSRSRFNRTVSLDIQRAREGRLPLPPLSLYEDRTVRTGSLRHSSIYFLLRDLGYWFIGARRHSISSIIERTTCTRVVSLIKRMHCASDRWLMDRGRERQNGVALRKLDWKSREISWPIDIGDRANHSGSTDPRRFRLWRRGEEVDLDSPRSLTTDGIWPKTPRVRDIISIFLQ